MCANLLFFLKKIDAPPGPVHLPRLRLWADLLLGGEGVEENEVSKESPNRKMNIFTYSIKISFLGL